MISESPIMAALECAPRMRDQRAQADHKSQNGTPVPESKERNTELKSNTYVSHAKHYHNFLQLLLEAKMLSGCRKF